MSTRRSLSQQFRSNCSAGAPVGMPSPESGRIGVSSIWPGRCDLVGQLTGSAAQAWLSCPGARQAQRFLFCYHGAATVPSKEAAWPRRSARNQAPQRRA